jgi:small subunit ribosomal protein S14
MARQAKIQKDHRLKQLNTNAQRQKIRSDLKKVVSSTDPSVTPEEKMAAAFKLQRRPRNESKTRHTNRCPHCGRIHGYMRRFDLCRLCVRKFFWLAGLPGASMSSW